MSSQAGVVRRLPISNGVATAPPPVARPLKAESVRADNIRRASSPSRGDIYRLRQGMAAEQICEGLWQCRVDQVPTLVQALHPDLVVNLTDKFYTPQPGVMGLTWPLADDGKRLPDLRLLEQLSLWIATQLLDNRAVIVCCEMGVNRSSLLSALVYRLVFRVKGAAAMAHIRAKRPTSLTNAAFSEYLQSLKEPA